MRKEEGFGRVKVVRKCCSFRHTLLIFPMIIFQIGKRHPFRQPPLSFRIIKSTNDDIRKSLMEMDTFDSDDEDGFSMRINSQNSTPILEDQMTCFEDLLDHSVAEDFNNLFGLDNELVSLLFRNKESLIVCLQMIEFQIRKMQSLTISSQFLHTSKQLGYLLSPFKIFQKILS